MSEEKNTKGVSLKVDHREQKLKPLFDTNNVKVTYENLTFGDFQILLNNEICYILERKTIDDLLASVKDGRYSNQKAKLFENFQSHQIYYIIEGSIPYLGQSTTDKIVTSAVINTMVRDKIAIFNTKNLNETYQLIMGLFDRISKDPQKYLHPEVPKEQIQVETNTSDNPSKIFHRMLCQIPGVSGKNAEVLITKWPNFQIMYNELQVLNVEERLKVLSSIKINTRKISKKIVEGILKAFF
jgi:ERCC4-type nuclease